jgi:hypothetical protein
MPLPFFGSRTRVTGSQFRVPHAMAPSIDRVLMIYALSLGAKDTATPRDYFMPRHSMKSWGLIRGTRLVIRNTAIQAMHETIRRIQDDKQAKQSELAINDHGHIPQFTHIDLVSRLF